MLKHLAALRPCLLLVGRAPVLQASAPLQAQARGVQSGQQGSADEAAEGIFEKGTKRMMQSDDGREELRAGTFDLDRTTQRVLEEGGEAFQEEEGGECGAAEQAKEAAGRVAQGESPEVAQRVKERVIGTLGESS